jgi:hypothetical protein
MTELQSCRIGKLYGFKTEKATVLMQEFPVLFRLWPPVAVTCLASRVLRSPRGMPLLKLIATSMLPQVALKCGLTQFLGEAGGHENG